MLFDKLSKLILGILGLENCFVPLCRLCIVMLTHLSVLNKVCGVEESGICLVFHLVLLVLAFMLKSYAI